MSDEIPEKYLTEIRERRARLAEMEERLASPDFSTKAERRERIVEAATAARFRAPELVGRILDGDEGDPAELVAKLATDHAYLVEPTMNELIRRGAGRSGRSDEQG